MWLMHMYADKKSSFLRSCSAACCIVNGFLFCWHILVEFVFTELHVHMQLLEEITYEILFLQASYDI